MPDEGPRQQVTNGDYLDFVRTHLEWQRGRVPATLADSRYLQHWSQPLKLGAQAPADQPVTHVSWFAASAYYSGSGTQPPNPYGIYDLHGVVWEWVETSTRGLRPGTTPKGM